VIRGCSPGEAEQVRNGLRDDDDGKEAEADEEA
jgi:hypothetical protein